MRQKLYSILSVLVPALIPLPSRAASLTPSELNAVVPGPTEAEATSLSKSGPGNHNKRMLRWDNVLRSLSRMKGIECYSITHGRARVLFRNAYVIDNAGNQKPLPDPLVSTIPANSTLTILQDDSTFGEAIFHLHYRSTQDALSMSMVNLNTLFLWFIPVIGDKHLLLRLVLVSYKGHLLIYGGVVVKTILLFGLQNATRDSFVNRIEALHTWFQTVEESR